MRLREFLFFFVNKKNINKGHSIPTSLASIARNLINCAIPLRGKSKTNVFLKNIEKDTQKSFVRKQKKKSFKNQLMQVHVSR